MDSILGYVKSGVYFLTVLSVLVLVHEWGHFIVAKLCKMRVDDFSLFFGKRLLRLGVRNGTEYNIRSIPLGGFVKIAGMEPDDISNGAPLFHRDPKQSRFAKTLRGLDREALEKDINWDNVSERIEQAVVNAVADGTLTKEGEAELFALSVSASVTADEQRYLELVLAAGKYIPDPNAYNQKPLWQRAATIFAGPLLSLSFGYLLFCVMGVTVGLPDLKDKHIAVGYLEPGKPAQLAGLKQGDYLLTVNGTDIMKLDDPLAPIHDSPGKPLAIVVMRDKQPVAFTITPYASKAEVIEKGKKVEKTIGLLGFKPDLAWNRYSPMESVQRGTQLITLQVQAVLRLFTNFGEAKHNMGGILSIAGEIHQNSQEGMRQVVFTAAMLSVSLGIMNLLPIPILDGGHLLLLAIEGIRRRKLTLREIAVAQGIGISLIAVLFIFVMYNDIVRMLPHK